MPGDSKARVLIVDDMQAMQTQAGTYTALGAEIAGQAENGEIALELYRAGEAGSRASRYRNAGPRTGSLR